MNRARRYDERHSPPFERPSDRAHRRREAQPPLRGVDVVDEAHDRPAPPQRREERDAVGDVDEDVTVPHLPGVRDRRPQVLGELAAQVLDRVRPRANRPAAHEPHVVPAYQAPPSQPVQKHLRPARLRMGEVTPRGEADAQWPTLDCVHVGTRASLPP